MKPAPQDIRTLARDLGISRAHLRKLQARHGDKLRHRLQRQWRSLHGDAPRLLANQNGVRNAGQYTGSEIAALPDEPEAVQPHAQEALTVRSRRTFEALRADEMERQERRSRAARLRNAEIAVRKAGHDPTPHIARIETEIRAMEQRSAA